MIKLLTDGPLVAICAGLGFVLAAVAPPSPAISEEVDARGSVRCEGLLNTEEEATVVDARVDFETDIGPLTVGGAYRVYNLGEGDYNPARIDPVQHLKHRYVEANTGGGLLVRAGHFFATFGRGLTLRSFEDIDLEHDTALDGFLAEYQAAPVSLTGLAGQMTEELTDVQYWEYMVRGARAQAWVGEVFSVAVSTLARNSNKHDEQIPLPDSLARFADKVLGNEIEMWMGPVSVAGEYALRSGDYHLVPGQREVDGWGKYLSATLNTSLLSVVGEYKDYHRFEHTLMSPPTCVKEHLWTLMNRVTHEVNLDNERGFLVEGMLVTSENMQIIGGTSEARTQGGGLVHWEIFTHLDRVQPRWGIRSVASSWSREYLYGKFTEYISGAIDLEFTAGPADVIEVGFEAQSTEEPSGETHEDYLASLALYPQPNMTMTAVWETTTGVNVERDVWVFWEWRVEILEDLEISFGAGSERGGKKCSGGICFVEPEFVGIRVRLWSYF